MLNIQMNSLQPLGGNCCNNYKGIAFDGFYYYFTVRDSNEIHKYNLCFQEICCIKTCREYTSICYDSYNNCYFALSDSDKNKIYKLNSIFVEIDYLKVNSDEYSDIELSGICCYDNCSLIVCGNKGIIKISSMDGTPICLIEEKQNDIDYYAVDKCDCNIIKATTKNNENIFSLVNNCNQEIIHNSIPFIYKTEDMCSTITSDGCCHIKILITKNECYSYILGCYINKIYECNDLINLPPIENCDNPCLKPCPEPCFVPKYKLCHEFYYKQCPDPCFDPCHEPCHEPCDKSCHKPCHEPYDKPCNEPCGKPCHKPCDKPCHEPCDKPCHEPCDKPCHDDCHHRCHHYIASLMESIALEGAALSHILNAEGEKIQKILCATDDPCEILKINEAVNKTITNTVHLEQLLYDKLQSVKEICCCINYCQPDCDKKPKPKEKKNNKKNENKN